MPALGRVLYREWVLFTATQSTYWGALVEPVLYLLFFLPGMGALMPARAHWALFALPGVLTILAMTVSQHVGAPVFFDRYTGEAETLTTLPVASGWVTLGRLVTALVRMPIQAALAIALAWILFATVRAVSPVSLAVLWLLAGVSAVVLSTLTLWAATVVANPAQFNLVFGLLMTPLLLTSAAFYPVSDLPSVMRVLASVNPVTYLVIDMRATTAGAAALSPWSIGVPFVVAVVAFVLVLRGQRQVIG